jgi:hypothetical protein
MGLDMYLTREHYVKNWYFMKPSERHQITVLKNGASVDHIKPERISAVVEDVAYWRKANQIHAWFVKNVQDGRDDCGHYYVAREQLQQLLTAVEDVLADHSKAATVLPSQQGFFFGATDYDQYYFDDFEHTKKVLSELLAEPGDGEYHYHSSW